MIKEAIDRILQLALLQHIEIGGRSYTNQALIPVKEPISSAIEIETLTGLIDYLQSNVDNLDHTKLMIHVADYRTVYLCSNLMGEFKQREYFIKVQKDPCPFQFSRFIGLEPFIIGLQSQFVQDETTAAILKIVGNVQESAVVQFNDDGVTQQVTAKTGVAHLENVVIPNLVKLAPYRTFTEINQPASSFVFRMRSGKGEPPECALFEADGGAWENDAMSRIKLYLDKELEGTGERYTTTIDIPVIS